MELHSFPCLMGLHYNNGLFPTGIAAIGVGGLIENMVHGTQHNHW